MSLADARETLEDWPLSASACIRLPGNGRHYNEDSPHSAIGYNVPIDKHYPDGVTSPSSRSEPGNSSFWRSKVGAQGSLKITAIGCI
jgi:hypothetical protein